MPQVSVVVPVYNVERYVSYCLDSLRRQSLNDIEIVCVIDGSQDRSEAIVDAHASLDERIVVVRKENGGLSSARNAGMKAAKSPYIMFLDSDDYLEKKACEIVLASFLAHDADIVTFGANCVPSQADNPWFDSVLSPEDRVFDGFDEALLFDASACPFAWRTALSTEFVRENGISFDEHVLFGEDQIFHFEIYPLSKCTVLLSDKLYNYRISRKDSLMQAFAYNPDERVPRHIEIVDAILSHWQQRDLMGLCPERMLDWVLGFLCFDLFEMPKDKQRKCAARLGEVLSKYFSDPVAVASSTFPVLGEVATVVIDIYAGRADEVPEGTVSRYRRYRIGLKRLIIDRICRILPRKMCVCDMFNRAKQEIDSSIELNEAEASLNASLSLLQIELAAAGKSSVSCSFCHARRKD